MNAQHGQRFEFDERFAEVEFATASSVRLAVKEARLVPLDSKISTRLRTNPHVGYVDVHYPTDGGRPIFVRMELEQQFCNAEYAKSLYAILAELLCLPTDVPYEIWASPKGKYGLIIEEGESRFVEIPCFHNKDSFEVPEGFWEMVERHAAEKRSDRAPD